MIEKEHNYVHPYSNHEFGEQNVQKGKVNKKNVQNEEPLV